jgi:hypothetical protein
MGVGQEHMPKSKLTPEILTAAIAGFEQQKVQIDSQIAELRAMLSGASTQTAVPEALKRKRGKLSAAARKRIAAAQKARWAKWRRESRTAAAPPAPKAKRRFSAAARARLAANLKKARAAKAAKVKVATAKKVAPARKKSVAKKAPQRVPPATSLSV